MFNFFSSEIAEFELNSIKEKSSVYVRPKNGTIFFKSDHISALNNTRKELDQLKKKKNTMK